MLLILTSLCLYHSFHYSGTVIDSCYNKLRSSSLKTSSSSSSSTTLYSTPSVVRSDENIANSTSSSGSLTISNGRKKLTSFLGKLRKKSTSTSSSTQQPISIPLSIPIPLSVATAVATGSTVISSRSSNKIDDVNKQEEHNIRSIDDLYDDDSDGNDDNIYDNQHNDDVRRIDVSTSLTLTDSSVDNTVSIESLEDYLDFGDQHIGSYRDSTDSSSDSSRGISRQSSSSSSGRGGRSGRDDDDRSVVDGGGEDIAEIIDLIDLRAEARFNRNYDEADRLRERLKTVGS